MLLCSRWSRFATLSIATLGTRGEKYRGGRYKWVSIYAHFQRVRLNTNIFLCVVYTLSLLSILWFSMPLLRLLISLLIAVLATGSASTAAPTTTSEITLQVTAEELGLECLSLYGADSSDAISKFLLHIHVGPVTADLHSDHASPSTIPQVHLSVLSSRGEVMRSIVLKDPYPMDTHDLLSTLNTER